MNYLDKLQLDLSKEIDAILTQKRSNAARGMLYSQHSDDIAEAVRKGLEKDAQSLHEFIKMDNNLNHLAKGLVRAADQLDAAGEEVAVAHLEDAIEKLAATGSVSIEDVPESKDDLETTGLILAAVADNLDSLGHEEIVNHIDAAIASLNKKSCDCGGSCCKGA